MFQKQLLLCFIAKKEKSIVAIAHAGRYVLIPNMENGSNISLQNSHFIFIIFTLEVKHYQLVTVRVLFLRFNSGLCKHRVTRGTGAYPDKGINSVK